MFSYFYVLVDMAVVLNQPDCRYYVYLLIDPRTNVPFYVGKGSGRRAKVSRSRESIKIGVECEIKFVATSLSHIEALRLEIEQIRQYGRVRDSGCLINRTLGGGGMRGYISEETKRKLSQIMKGKFVGKQMSDSTRKKMRTSHLGVKKGPHTADARFKISESCSSHWTKLKQLEVA
jgi:hypothetical protein